jgi:hypothetical protein
MQGCGRQRCALGGDDPSAENAVHGSLGAQPRGVEHAERNEEQTGKEEGPSADATARHRRTEGREAERRQAYPAPETGGAPEAQRKVSMHSLRTRGQRG